MRKLKVTDQIHVSSVQADTLQPRQEITVTNSLAEQLLKQHPASFEDLGDAEEADEKAAPEPENKAAPAHADKAVIGLERKRKPKKGA